MLPGGGIPGRDVISQISDRRNAAVSGNAFTLASSLPTTGKASITEQGQTLTPSVSLIAGHAVGSAATPGKTITVNTSLIAGTAAVSAVASGDVLQTVLTLDEGAATVSAVASGDTLVITPSIIAGEAIGDVVAPGTVLDVSTTVIAGVASGEQPQRRVAGGTALVRRRRRRRGDAIAPGAILELGTSIVAGSAQVGHEITVHHADGSTTFYVCFGLTDEQLRSNEFTTALLMDDLDGYMLGLYKDREAA
ncbi:hypothetical protein JQ628_05010 [Bradyrhizobium lablabi]|uniref:hypothetical protein n=1 Tax=Bradyrhizobium lablabi TaxID=722472 RepID=UPI001BA8EFCC|nr:hypothetical protein [Bradyrhizobium lablabi]MBR1120868.1 hypothetical protein [Bradyrhizobium lablabi]